MDIVIVSTELSSKKEDVLKNLSDDIRLTKTMIDYRKELESQNIEIFEHHNNILITEKGYYIAIDGKRIRKITKVEDK